MSETTLRPYCVAEAIQAAVSPIFPGAVFPHQYKGPLLEYVVWNYNQVGEVWAEGVPHAARYLVQVHLYSPHGKDPREAILKLQRALFDQDFTWPIPTDATDSDGQHWVLECEYTDGGGFYGFA